MKTVLHSLYRQIQSLLRGSQGNEFYYHSEQTQYEESVESSRLRYMMSFDKAA